MSGLDLEFSFLIFKSDLLDEAGRWEFEWTFSGSGRSCSAIYLCYRSFLTCVTPAFDDRRKSTSIINVDEFIDQFVQLIDFSASNPFLFPPCRSWLLIPTLVVLVAIVFALLMVRPLWFRNVTSTRPVAAKRKSIPIPKESSRQSLLPYWDDRVYFHARTTKET